jgi:hypothetical protein
MLNFLVVCNVPMTFERQLPTSGQQNLGGTTLIRRREAEYKCQRLTKAEKKMFCNASSDRTLKGSQRCRTISVLQQAGAGRIFLLVTQDDILVDEIDQDDFTAQVPVP